VVLRGDLGFKIWAPDKWQLFILPVAFERIRSIRTQGNNLNIAADEFGVILTQLRQMSLAVWSGKPAHQHEQDRLLTPEISQVDLPILSILKSKIDCLCNFVFGIHIPSYFF